MGNEIYMNIRITEYGNGRIDCKFSESINDEELRTKDITLDKARRLMWELKLAGGRKEVIVNRYDRDIVTRSVYIFLEN